MLALNRDRRAQRRFILIEQGRPEKGDSYARSLTADRLRRVVTGDWANGKGSPLRRWLRVRDSSTKKVDAEALLQMERDEMVDTVIASLLRRVSRRGPSLDACDDPELRLPRRQEQRRRGLLPGLGWAGRSNTDFTEEVYEALRAERRSAPGSSRPTTCTRGFNLYPDRRTCASTRSRTGSLPTSDWTSGPTRIAEVDDGVIELFQFQRERCGLRSSSASRSTCDDPVIAGRRTNHTWSPSSRRSRRSRLGKTVILADAVATIAGELPVAPVVLWLSKGKVVVEQSFANLCRRAASTTTSSATSTSAALADYDPDEVAESTEPAHLLRDSRDVQPEGQGGRQSPIYKSDIDTTDTVDVGRAQRARSTQTGIAVR